MAGCLLEGITLLSDNGSHDDEGQLVVVTDDVEFEAGTDLALRSTECSVGAYRLDRDTVDPNDDVALAQPGLRRVGSRCHRLDDQLGQRGPAVGDARESAACAARGLTDEVDDRRKEHAAADAFGLAKVKRQQGHLAADGVLGEGFLQGLELGAVLSGEGEGFFLLVQLEGVLGPAKIKALLLDFLARVVDGVIGFLKVGPATTLPPNRPASSEGATTTATCWPIHFCRWCRGYCGN